MSTKGPRGRFLRVKRLLWRDAHFGGMLIWWYSPYFDAQLKFRLFLEVLFPLPVTKSSTEFAPEQRLSAA
jgi:hypothetical protein